MNRYTNLAKPWQLGIALSMALSAALFLASFSGALAIPWSALPHLFSDTLDADQQLFAQLLWQVRLPRVLFSALVGAALALTGGVMQALFRNPLAEPGLIGISSGAALGAVLAIVLTSAGFLGIATAAFIGSLVTIVLAYVIGSRFVGISGLLLAGIAINTIAGSGIGLLTYMATDNQLRDLTFWSMGSLAGGTWQILQLLALPIMALMVYLCKQWRALNALLLGEREATHLGYELRHLRWRLIIITALIVGPLVAVTGGIGFVGLVVPHLIRLLVGAQHRYLLPLSMLTGALLLTLADYFARVMISPAELPIGLMTSVIGGPFFLWLIIKARGLRI